MNPVRLFNHYTPQLSLMLAALEGGLIFLVFFFGLVPAEATSDPWALLRAASAAAVYASLFFICLTGMGLYSAESFTQDTVGSVLRIVVAFGLGVLGYAALKMFVPSFALEPRTGIAAAALALSAVVAFRGLLFPRVLRAGSFERRVLIVGAGQAALQLAQRLRAPSATHRLEVVGFLPTPGDVIAVDQQKLIEADDSLSAIVKRLKIDEVVVLADDENHALPTEQALECRFAGVSVSSGLQFVERELRLVDLELLARDSMLDRAGFAGTPLAWASKRLFDLLFAAVILAASLPLILITVIAIKLEDGLRAPVLYSQQRVGRGGHNFRIFKFRSMRTDAEADGQARFAGKNDARVTRVGAFIRLVRIDELPQLWNVFRGDMSIVGPRPERPEFVEGFNQRIPFYNHRHQVQPGLTGWAQICYPYGDNEDDARQKLQFDLYYVKNQSFFLDMITLICTAEIVIFGRGAR